MNDGKNTEKLVRLIQEALKDIPNTEIYSNYRIKNQNGRKREIDVLVKSIINGLDILIAIECKDYKRPISVEKIEAFHSKCLRIKGISKKVFVTTSDYQADAYAAAKDFDIDLFVLSNLSKEKIAGWFPIFQLKPNIKIQLPFRLKLNGNKNDISEIPDDKELMIHYYEEKKPILISAFVWNLVVVPKHKMINSYMVLDFMKGNCRKEEGKLSRLPYTLEISGVYILGKNNKKLNVTKIESEIVCWYEDIPATSVVIKEYAKMDSIPVANTISVDIGKKESADIVITQDNDISIFHTKENGQVFPLKTLASYDPKTGELKINNN
jgi:hypothetical protein